MMKLEIEGLCVSLQGSPVLDRLDLGVREGEILALLGPSGCGKSTLLKTIAGLLPTAAGSIRIDGVDMGSVPAHRRGAVIVFQELRLFPHRNVADNIAFPLKMQGVDKKNLSFRRKSRFSTDSTSLLRLRLFFPFLPFRGGRT